MGIVLIIINRHNMYSLIIDHIIRYSNWYRNQFKDAERIKKAPHDLDVINFGSNIAKYGIDYSECGMNGYNFAVGPQTITFDYTLLLKYHTYLRPDGPRLLLLLFCPFSVCKNFYTEHDGVVYKNVRYYPILDKEYIPNYDDVLYERFMLHPSKLGLKALYCALRHRYSNNAIFDINSNRLSPDQMKRDAKNRMLDWKREFFLNDLTPDNLSDLVIKSLVYNSEILVKIKDFCDNHNINANIVIPPLSKELSEQIPQKFREKCFYSIIRDKNIPIYDYADDKELSNNDNFLNSLFLNKKGRVKFTNRVIADILKKNND